jgi:hypothetical protein
MRRLAVAIVVVSACYIQPAPGYGYRPPPQQQVMVAPQPPPNQPPPGQPPPGQPEPQRTTWAGRYTCAQGVTGLRLTLEGNCNGVSCSFSALFEFAPLPENPNVAHGSYHMTGEGHANAQGELELSLTPTQWVDQPANYMMVGLSVTADAQQQQMRGRMNNPSCSDISLSRVP